MEIIFLRHFQTKVDPVEPVSEWSLSSEGLESLEEFIESRDLDIDVFITSTEPK